MTTEEKFRAAVNVIRGLPKKGSYQPSTNVMLQFYGYFKQATEGPNNTPKPYLWEVVSKAKWDAWSKLGDMSKEDAMNSYLAGLNDIVEQMASSGNVEEFLLGMDEFYAKVPAKDVDLCIGPTIEKIRAKSSLPIPTLPLPTEVDDTSLKVFVPEDDEENFLDSIDTFVITGGANMNDSVSDQIVYVNGNSGVKNDYMTESSIDILKRSVFTLRKELTDISETVKRLEQQQKSVLKGRRQLFGNLSLQTIAFITVWPIFVNLGLIWLHSKRRRTN